jgi:hypothetical protein
MEDRAFQCPPLRCFVIVECNYGFPEDSHKVKNEWDLSSTFAFHGAPKQFPERYLDLQVPHYRMISVGRSSWFGDTV